MLVNLICVLERITGSLGNYFLEFTRIARDKPQLQMGSLQQFKTEKWLQAELAVRLRWTGCYGVVAEVAGKPFNSDLVVWPIRANLRPGR